MSEEKKKRTAYMIRHASFNEFYNTGGMSYDIFSYPGMLLSEQSNCDVNADK